MYKTKNKLKILDLFNNLCVYFFLEIFGFFSNYFLFFFNYHKKCTKPKLKISKIINKYVQAYLYNNY